MLSSTELEHLLVILGLFVLHLIVPGPNMLYICATASRGGGRGTSAFAVGTATGTAAWAAFVAFGGWQVLERLPPAIGEGLRLAVAVMLVAIGIRAILEA